MGSSSLENPDLVLDISVPIMPKTLVIGVILKRGFLGWEKSIIPCLAERSHYSCTLDMGEGSPDHCISKPNPKGMKVK